MAGIWGIQGVDGPSDRVFADHGNGHQIGFSRITTIRSDFRGSRSVREAHLRWTRLGTAEAMSVEVGARLCCTDTTHGSCPIPK